MLRSGALDRYGVTAGAAFGAIAIALLARVEIPFVPVPLTLLTFGAMLAGIALGPRGGAAAAALWVVAGAVGLPAFAAGKVGIGAILGPTGGYILALPIVPIGWSAVRRVRGGGGLFVAAAASLGHLALGALWLAAFVGARKAILVGFTPFVLAEAVKGAIAFALARTGRNPAPR